MSTKNPSAAAWASSLLREMNIHQTPGNVQALVGWAAAEGGHWHNKAKYNPLNTTQPMPGAGNTGSQGNIKVYDSWQQGLEATAKTLNNGRYGGIISALKSGDPTAVANAIGKTPWGTSGDLVARAIAGTPRVAGQHGLDVGTKGRAADVHTATKLIPGKTTQDTDAAIMDLLAAHKPGSKLKQLDSLLSTGSYDKTTPDKTVTTKTTTPAAESSTPAKSTDLIGSLVDRANALDKKRLPYLYGGGHAGGKVDPHTVTAPLDCSAAVSAVLGIDVRVSGQFAKWGSPGAGSGKGVVIYSNPGHVLMKINGHFFGTSGSNPGGGAGWIPQAQISPEYLKGFTARHAAAVG